jgi:lipid A 3-O-deacylase
MRRSFSVGATVFNVALLSISGTLCAQQSLSPSSYFLQGGKAGHTHELTAGAAWDWTRQWKLGRGQISGYWEVSVSQWSFLAADARRTAWLGKIGLIPVFRYRPSGGESPWFFEAGVGLTLTTSLYQTNRKRFSTHFNFGDHIALGRNFGRRDAHELSMRAQHFSNAGIKRPNPGEDFLQVRYAYRFM